jgi:hypothetical protein
MIMIFINNIKYDTILFMKGNNDANNQNIFSFFWRIKGRT